MTESPVATTAPDGAPEMQVRASDIEPYIGLRYLSKLFRFMAVFVLILVVVEVVLGLSAQGVAAVARLLIETPWYIVLAGVLWGAGDLAILMIDIGHDVRAARILIGRQAAHHLIEHHPPAAREAARQGARERGDDRKGGRGTGLA
jgi:hypothetical protein